MSDIITPANTPSLDWHNIAKTGQVPSGMRLMSEETEFKVAKTREVTNDSGKKVMRLTGIIQKADSFNENGRIYSRSILSEAVESIQEAVKRRKVMGELDHPEDAKIHIDRVSHLMTKVWMEGNNVLGELEVIEEMPCGQMLAALVRAGVTVGISSRGVGDMKPTMTEDQEAFEVLPGFRFVTWDTVAEPSVKEAELSVMESKQRKLLNKKNAESQLLKEISSFFGDRNE
jgi:hypothetical protein